MVRYSFYEKSKAIAFAVVCALLFFEFIKVFFGLTVVKYMVAVVIGLMIINWILNKFEEGR